ncbi:recombination protein NinG [Xenorhabdus bovienii]|uniref:recombination protein NinG n=1 Tax=Xenorhabdus bovienii TaxID=40576 RepID=UPI0021589F8E|nr:recombination protein NinG [Xenorhabdus bovienii]
MAKFRQRKCKECGERYEPERQLQNTCSVQCAIARAKKQEQEKREELERRRKKDNEIKQKLARDKLKTRRLAVKPLSHFARQAQTAFNAFIRERDCGHPCISCGRNTGAKMNAGHYRTVGSCPELRFDEDNCHIQCEHCNSYLSGNIENYTPRLIEKIGQARFDQLMSHHALPKRTREDYERLRDNYKDRLKELQGGRHDIHRPASSDRRSPIPTT